MKTLSSVLVMVFGLTLAHAQESSKTLAVSLQDCIQQALEHNLDLKVERYDPQIATLGLQGAYADYDPNLSISGAHNYSLAGGGVDPATHLPLPTSSIDQNSFNAGLVGLAPWGLGYNLQGNIAESYGSIGGIPSDNTRGSASFSLKQPLLKNFWLDGTRLNIRVKKLALQQSELKLRNTIIGVATSVELAYYDLIYARESVKVLEKAVELAAQSVRENRKRVEVGTMAPLDEKQAESQEAASRSDLLQGQRVLAAAENALKRLITERFSEIQPVELIPSDKLTAPSQVFDLQLSWNRGLSQRPDLLQAKLDVERAGVELKYYRNQLFPELDLVGSYGHGAGGFGISEFAQGFDELAKGNKPFYSYGAQLTFPLGNTGARTRYRASKLAKEQLILNIKKLEQDIMVAIDDAIKLAKASYQRMQATREAREYAQAALEAEQKKLENGKSTSFEVLRLQRDLTSASSDEIRSQTDYKRNLAQLSSFEASTLDRLGINLEVK
jgi:outer membrane protein TolC